MMTVLALGFYVQSELPKTPDLGALGGRRAGFGLPWKCPDNCRPHGSLDFEGFEALIFPAGSSSIRYTIAATSDGKYHLSRQTKGSGKFPTIDWVIELVVGGGTGDREGGTLRGFLSTFNSYDVKGKPSEAVASELDRKGGFAIYTRQYSGKPYWFYPHDYPDPDAIPSFDTFEGTWPWSKSPYPVTAEELAFLRRGS